MSSKDITKDSDYSTVKNDAGCTPKLSRRKSVASDCGRSLSEVLAKRSAGSSCLSGSSWLHAFKKSDAVAKRTVENRRKVCCPHLQFDSVSTSKTKEFSGHHAPLENTLTRDATNLYCLKKTSSSPAHVKIFSRCSLFNKCTFCSLLVK